MNESKIICRTPAETFNLGERLGESLIGGEIVLLYGGLGAGKTLFAKGILNSLDFDIDEVTSPSFTLVNFYKTASFDVYHIDLWRLDAAADAAKAVGLEAILENERAVTIVEWADRLMTRMFLEEAIVVKIEGDGDVPRLIHLEERGGRSAPYDA